MAKIQLGGIKILEGQSYIEFSSDKAEDALMRVSRRLGSEKINLSQVTFIADDGRGRSSNALCAESAKSFAARFLLNSNLGSESPSLPDITILSIFPHDRRPLVIGTLFELMAREDMHPLGIASSPSAMSVVVPAEDTKRAIEAIFSVFEFPSYRSPLEWQAAYVGKEELFKNVVGSYEEQTLTVYAVLDQPELDLWSMTLDRTGMKRLGAALNEIDGLGAKVPFIVAHCERPREAVICFCLARSYRQDAERIFDAHAPQTARSLCEAAGIFFHGPHFGDRYRIAGVLTGCLQAEGIRPLALSCAVHSISVILEAQDLSRGLQAIKSNFLVPKGNG